MAKTSLHAFKAKDNRFVADWLKSKGLHKLCSVLEGIQEPFTWSLACKSVVSRSIKPCLHTQLPEHYKSYRKLSWGWGHLITWNGPMMGHLNSFSASGGGNLNKNFPKIQMPWGLPGGGMLKLRFDWYIRRIKHLDRTLQRYLREAINFFLSSTSFPDERPKHTKLDSYTNLCSRYGGICKKFNSHFGMCFMLYLLF